MSRWHAWDLVLQNIERAKSSLNFAADEECFYRGHADSRWPLLPSLFRLQGRTSLRDLESDLFFEFQARARELHHQSLTEWDILFHMRHHGVPTRLLDWTESLGIALFFAVNEMPDPNDTPCVWLLNPYRLNEASVYERDLYTPRNLGWDRKERDYYDYGELLVEAEPFDWKKPVAIYPQQKSARMAAQRGWFTIHGQSTKPLEKQCPKVVRKVVIKSEAVPVIKEMMILMGIDKYLLFNDLDGLSTALSDKYHLNSSRKKGRRPRRRK